MPAPWDLPKSIAKELEELADDEGVSSLIVVEKMRGLAARLHELADDLRAGVMGERDRLAMADLLAHKHGEER